VLAAAEQALEVRGQLHHRARERFETLLALRVLARLGELATRLLHLLGEQRGAVDLDDLQRATRKMKQVRGLDERRLIAVTVDVFLALAARRIERGRELAIDQVKRVCREIVQVTDRHTSETLFSRTSGAAR